MGLFGDHDWADDPNEVSEGEYLSEIEDRVHFVDSEEYRRPKKPKQSKPKKRTPGKHHYPENDSEAIAIIRGLEHPEWETHKVSGTFVHNPYSLTATVNGELHTIHLRGRYGSVLTWLRDYRPPRKA